MVDQALPPELFAQLVDSVGVGVGIYGADGRFVYVNRAYADLFDADAEQLRGAAIWDVVRSVDADRFDGYWASFEDGETRTDEAEHVYGGVAVPVETVTTRRRIDGVPYNFGTIKDITERKRREQQLRGKNERLDSFASVVSHDLRNPLNVAQGYLDVLGEDVDGDDGEAVERIDRSLSRMERLIDDLLTLSRRGDGVGETESVPVDEAAVAAWQMVQAGDATLEAAHGGTVVADRTRLGQLFENLFRNAVQHGGDGVAVRVGALADGRGFFVGDDGCGIDPGVEDCLFDSGVTTHDDGTGVGLLITDEIASAHGWEVSVGESDTGGARFEFRTG